MNKKASEILIAAREKKGLTQTDVAKMLVKSLGQTYSLRQYQRIEAGDFPKYKKEVIQALDEILDTKLYDIIYEGNSDLQEPQTKYGKEPLETALENLSASKLIDSKNIERLITLLEMKLGVIKIPPAPTENLREKANSGKS